MRTLPAMLHSAPPTLGILTLAALLSGCHQNHIGSVSLVLPDFHNTDHTAGQLYIAPVSNPHHHMRAHAAVLRVTLSRHPAHH